MLLKTWRMRGSVLGPMALMTDSVQASSQESLGAGLEPIVVCECVYEGEMRWRLVREDVVKLCPLWEGCRTEGRLGIDDASDDEARRKGRGSSFIKTGQSRAEQPRRFGEINKAKLDSPRQ
jgi:hypothetical protein